MDNQSPENASGRNKGNAPVKLIDDNNHIKGAIFRNVSKDGRPFYNVTFARTYRDADGNLKDTQSFSRTDLLKLSRLADQAYHEINELRKQDRAQSKEQVVENSAAQNKAQSLSEQRDTLMSQNRTPASAETAQSRGPEVHSHGPEPSQ